MIHKNSLSNLIYNSPIPVEWNGEWWESQKSLSEHVGCSTGRVSACYTLGHKLRGFYVLKSTL